MNRQAWTGPTLRSFCSAPQVNLEHLVANQVMIGSFEPCIDVNQLTEWVINETGMVDVPQRRMCHFLVLYSCQVVRSITSVVRVLG